MYDIVAIALSLSLFHLNKKISVVEEWIEFVFENIEWDSPRERVRSTPKTPQGRRKIIQPKQFLLSNAYPQPKRDPFKQKE